MVLKTFDGTTNARESMSKTSLVNKGVAAAAITATGTAATAKNCHCGTAEQRAM